MDFSRRKLPAEEAANLRRCPIETVKPFAMMIAPVYVFMRRNEKFISVKSPLDFFTPEELERFKDVEMLFMPEFVDSVLPYRGLARRVKMMLGWNPVDVGGALPPAPYELSDGVLRMTAPLWGTKYRIEPFFAGVFVNELCSLLPGEDLMAAREKDIELFERAIILSAWTVFFSLHLGAADQVYLDRVRLASFRKVMGTEIPQPGTLSLDNRSDAGELFRLMSSILEGDKIRDAVEAEVFFSRSERVAQKISARLRRVFVDG
jgi:hypothetical protein